MDHAAIYAIANSAAVQLHLRHDSYKTTKTSGCAPVPRLCD